MSPFAEARPYSCIVVCLFALAVEATAQQPPRDAANAPVSAPASISGVVVTDEANSRPVRRAIVSLTLADAARGAGGRAVVTDDDGRFSFSPLTPGRYAMSVSKPGYITTAYGALRPGRPGTPIQLAASQRLEGISIRLARGAVITGNVVDQNGEPVPSARVVLMRYTFSSQNGERSLQPTAAAGTTDDRGTYRIYGITPGEYIVQLNAPFSLPGDLRQMTDQSIQAALQQMRTPAGGGAPPTPAVQAPAVAYAPLFYPGATAASNATVLKLAPGDERGGVDFEFQLVPTAKIEGVVTGPNGAPATNAQVSVLGSGPAEGSMNMMLSSLFGAGRPDPEGKFTLSGIAPGHYTLAARTTSAGRGGQNASDAMSWATAEVDVNGQDVSGVRLVLEPGMRIAGRVAFQGNGTPPADVTGVRVTLNPILSGNSVAAVPQPVQADAQGTFSIDNVTPGRYRVGASSPQGWILKSAISRARETLDTGLDVRPNEQISDVLLTFTDRTTTLTGALQDATGRPASDYFIIAYAKDRALWSPPSRRIAMMRPASDGKFSTRILPPGEYLLAAVTDVEPGEWMDPSFLEQLVPASIPVALADGETKTQDIRIAGR